MSKNLTAKSLNYSHKCGQDNNNTQKSSLNIIECKNEIPEETQAINEIKQAPTKSTFPNYESSPRIQMMQDKREMKKLFKDAL